MNCERGFRRITFLVAIIASACCAFIAVVILFGVSNNARSQLISAEMDYNEFVYEIRSRMPDGFVPDPNNIQAQQALAELEGYAAAKKATLEHWENDFWANLSTAKLSVLFAVGGAVAGSIGFFAVWSIYKFLRWIVLGFVSNTPNKPESP